MIARAHTIPTHFAPPEAPSASMPQAPDATTANPLDNEVFPHHADAIPPGVISAGSYELRFAWTRSDLHEVQALRYRVFREALGQDGDSANSQARDEDQRDPWFHHLMIVHRESGAVVGTYRLQTVVMAATRYGFYSAEFFELGGMPGGILSDAVEIGRACVAPSHRNGRVLHLLWRGLARYLQWNGKRHLFGCCSVPGLDPQLARDMWGALHGRGVVHETMHVRPRPFARAIADDGRTVPPEGTEAVVTLPPLFEAYLSLGARICGAPAFDREFGTTDFLVLLDTQTMSPRAYQSFFG